MYRQATAHVLVCVETYAIVTNLGQVRLLTVAPVHSAVCMSTADLAIDSCGYDGMKGLRALIEWCLKHSQRGRDDV